LNRALKSLRHLPELGFVFFDTRDVVRHALLEKIITAYNTTSESGEK
jgi:phosphate starvation-inducible PhoH-like protein